MGAGTVTGTGVRGCNSAKKLNSKARVPASASAFVKTTGQWVGSKQQQRSVAGLASELSSLPDSLIEDVGHMVKFLKGQLKNLRKLPAEMSLAELYHCCKQAASTRIGAEVMEMVSIMHFSMLCSW